MDSNYSNLVDLLYLVDCLMITKTNKTENIQKKESSYFDFLSYSLIVHTNEIGIF